MSRIISLIFGVARGKMTFAIFGGKIKNRHN